MFRRKDRGRRYILNVLMLGLILGFQVNSSQAETQQNLEPTVEKSVGNQSTGEAAFFRLEADVVTSASGYAQPIIDSPHAIDVITAEDIVQSGTLDITQLFRFSPGTMVVEADSQNREVIIRGNPQIFSPRLLVLMDGIPLYSPLFSGVTWSFLPFSLPNIERIEVIRGASSTLYGANAFSGVINIITKKIDKKTGFKGYVSVGNLGISQDDFIVQGPITDKSRYRLSLEFRNDNGYGSNNGDGQFDSQVGGHGMLDMEFDLGDRTNLKFYSYVRGAQRQEGFRGFLGNQEPYFIKYIGGIKLNHDVNENQNLSFQTTFQNLDQKGFTTTPSDQVRREVDAEVRYTSHFGERDSLLGGASFRTGGYRFINFTPPGLVDLTLASVFVNNDFKILPNLILTTGGRYEYDTFTNSHLTGRGNLTWIPLKGQSFRASFARAVRTPSVIEESLNLTNLTGVAPPPFPPQTVVDASGNNNLKAETVLAAEFGYVGRFLDNKLKANVQFYYNDINNLIALGLQNFNPGAVPPMATFQFQNAGNGEVLGVEMSLVWDVFDWYQTGFNYTFTKQFGFETGRFPTSLVSFKNRFMLDNGFSTDILFNYTSPYAFFDVLTGSSFDIPQIFRLDVRIAQRINKHWELAIVGQNLVDSPHIEAAPDREVDRLIYGMITFRK